MKYKGFLVITLVCVLLLSAHIFAGTGKRIATAGATELLIPVGARSTALAGASVAGVGGIDAIYWNPAGVALADQNTEALFSYQNWIGDINVTYLAATSKLGAIGSLGLSVKTLNFGDIMETTVANPEGTGSTFSPSYLTLGVTYSRKMTDRILFGATAKMVSEKIMGTAATGVGFDFGLQYVSPLGGLKLGVVLTNFGADMKFDGSNLEVRTVLPGTEAGTTLSSVAIPPASFDLPSQLKIGVSYPVQFGQDMGLDVMGTFVNNAYSFDQYIVGAEFDFRNAVFFRAAYALAYKEGLEDQSEGFVSANEDFLFGPSFGLGLKLGKSVPIALDYAYQVTEFFNDAQWLSLTVGF
ncbi:PorV/PorQ family protein [candidate division KSB1 bacterium]|nr:PorV/PorQ family protein [candidate division KSB1 bacterium]RQW05672.1 MAG: PorV/PorQ family protein [candidate division KSB1 bacterium]